MLVRDDDVFRLGGKYTSYGQAVDRVKEVHRIIANEGAIHVVALICGTLDWFPGGIEFLKEAKDKGELIPEIHGWDHIDYSKLPVEEIVNHLIRCSETIYTHFNYEPKKFYTPWGATSLKIKEASKIVGLELVDCSNILYPKRKFFGGKMWESYSQLVREDRQELFIHWWQDKWFTADSHSLVNTLRTVRENNPIFFNKVNNGD